MIFGFVVALVFVGPTVALVAGQSKGWFYVLRTAGHTRGHPRTASRTLRLSGPSHARGWLEGSGSSTFPPFGADKAKRGERRGKRESLRETENWAESDSALSEGVPGIDSNPAAAQADAKRPPAQLKRCTPLKVPWSTAPTRAGAPPYSAPSALESGCLTTPSPLTPRDMLTGPRLAPHPPTPACRTGLAPGSRY